MNPSVSVVIPTYNRPDMLSVAVKSVLAQTVHDVEVIVVDDASACDNQAMLDTIADNRIRYVRHEANKRLPGSRNTGIHLSRGRFIAFLDDDDYWLPQKLHEQLAFTDRYEVVVCGNYLDNDTTIRVVPVAEVTLKHLFKENPFAPSGYVIRAEVMRANLFDERLRFGEDWDLLMRMAGPYRIRNVRKPLFLRRAAGHPTMTNALSDQNLESLEDTLLAIEKHKDSLGPFWYKYRKASRLLSYIGNRDDRMQRVARTIARCGFLPTTRVVLDKLARRY